MVRSRSFAGALAALLCMAGSAGAAQAQTRTFYLRQRLVGMATGGAVPPTYTYTPTYGAYGSCTGGTQTASIATCTRSDNQVVANSFCSPQTMSTSCSISCATPIQYRSYSGGGTRVSVNSSYQFSTAASYCQGAATTSGACQIQNLGGKYYVFYIPGAVVVNYNDNTVFAGACG